MVKQSEYDFAISFMDKRFHLWWFEREKKRILE